MQRRIKRNEEGRLASGTAGGARLSKSLDGFCMNSTQTPKPVFHAILVFSSAFLLKQQNVGELRGGAWVVIDPSVNPNVMEMYTDDTTGISNLNQIFTFINKKATFLN